jgi:hypothetical protein
MLLLCERAWVVARALPWLVFDGIRDPDAHSPILLDGLVDGGRKPTDKNLPDGIEEVIIGEGVQQYKNLRDLEKRLDHGS